VIKKISPILLISLFLILLLSCSFNPNEELQNIGLNRLADLKLYNTTYKVVNDDSPPIVIEAKKIEIYKKEKKVIITEAVFNQYEKENKHLMSGSFGLGEIDTDTNEMKLSDGVILNHLEEQLSIISDYLYWDNKNQIVSGTDENRVKLINKEHDIIIGRGFKGDFSSATFEFQFLEEGVLVYD